MVCLSVAALRGRKIPPVLRVCEVLHDLPSYHDKVVAVVDGFPIVKREGFLSEKTCGSTKSEGHPIRRDPGGVLSKSAPKPARDLYFDRSLVDKELELIRRQTSLAELSVRSQNYDVGRVVYGRIEINKDLAARSKPLRNEFEPAAARIVCTSKSMVVFLAD